MTKGWAVTFIIVGFPYFLLGWLGRLFGICKRKPVNAAVEWGEEPATDRQIGFIRHLGGKPTKGMTKSEASFLIEDLLAKRRRNL